MAEILITGGAGNFGRTLGNALREKGHSLRLFDLPSCDFSFCDAWENTRVIAGDILRPETLPEALEGAQWIFHLAAVLPPASEEDRRRTFRVNVEGTRCVVDACTCIRPEPNLVFASSVSVYGDTTGHSGLIRSEHPVNPDDIYAESKVEAEKVIRASQVPWVNLRISGIAIPEFLDPPEPWPWTKEQRIELVSLADVVTAMLNLVDVKALLNKTLIISGGPTWQVTGEDYVRHWGEVMEIPLEEMSFLEDRNGWLNWYDSSESQALLAYQKTTLKDFLAQLKVAVDEATGE